MGKISQNPKIWQLLRPLAPQPYVGIVRVYYGRPLSVSGRPCYILPRFFFYFLMAALFSGPGERRFAKVLHVVDLECHYRSYYLDFFLVILKLHGVPKSVEIWHIFRPRPQTFCSHARTRQNIVILKKNLLSTDGFSTIGAVSGSRVLYPNFLLDS